MAQVMMDLINRSLLLNPADLNLDRNKICIETANFLLDRWVELGYNCDAKFYRGMINTVLGNHEKAKEDFVKRLDAQIEYRSSLPNSVNTHPYGFSNESWSFCFYGEHRTSLDNIAGFLYHRIKVDDRKSGDAIFGLYYIHCGLQDPSYQESGKPLTFENLLTKNTPQAEALIHQACSMWASGHDDDDTLGALLEAKNSGMAGAILLRCPTSIVCYTGETRKYDKKKS